MKQLLMLLVKGYRAMFSRLLPPACRFYPTCSQYMLTALERYGALRGGILGLWRILRCNPWGRPGLDPVPVRKPGERFGSILRRTGVKYAQDASDLSSIK